LILSDGHMMVKPLVTAVSKRPCVAIQ
jgi:hypothetical protein